MSGRIDQLRAIVYGALYFNIPLKPSAAEVEKKRKADYQQLLTVKGQLLPDPRTDLSTGWIGEASGIHL